MTELLGIRTRAAREDLQWSQEELALKSGLSRGHISMLERGERVNVSAPTLVALADALETSIDWLLGRVNTDHMKRCRCHHHKKLRPI